MAYALIEIETVVTAPVERCFDLSRSVEVHLRSTAHTRERVVGGVASGLLGPGDGVTWEAVHLGLRLRLSTKISGFERPRWFRDELVRGPLRRLVHDHVFEPTETGTLMRDRFEFGSWLPPLDAVVLRPHFRRLLLQRNNTIKQLAEAEDWRGYAFSTP